MRLSTGVFRGILVYYFQTIFSQCFDCEDLREQVELASHNGPFAPPMAVSGPATGQHAAAVNCRRNCARDRLRLTSLLWKKDH